MVNTGEISDKIRFMASVRRVLALLWEAADRICGKGLKALLPVLIESMEHHGHVKLDALEKTKLLGMSGANCHSTTGPRMASGRPNAAAAPAGSLTNDERPLLKT